MTLLGSRYLTGERRIAVPGMAHFAGEGPPGTICSACLFLDQASKRRRKDGLWAKCHRYTQLMQGHSGPAFPIKMDACRHFEPAPTAARPLASPHPRQDASLPWPARGGTSAPGTSGDDKMDMTKFGGDQFLKIEDIRATGPIRALIEGLEDGPFGRPIASLSNGSSLQLNITNTRRLINVWGANSDSWINREIELAIDQIEYRGELTDSIVVRPISATIPIGERKAPPAPNRGVAGSLLRFVRDGDRCGRRTRGAS
jgi:hypothetical protein